MTAEKIRAALRRHQELQTTIRRCLEGGKKPGEGLSVPEAIHILTASEERMQKLAARSKEEA